MKEMMTVSLVQSQQRSMIERLAMLPSFCNIFIRISLTLMSSDRCTLNLFRLALTIVSTTSQLSHSIQEKKAVSCGALIKA